jgi:hypothetical protein
VAAAEQPPAVAESGPAQAGWGMPERALVGEVRGPRRRLYALATGAPSLEKVACCKRGEKRSPDEQEGRGLPPPRTGKEDRARGQLPISAIHAEHSRVVLRVSVGRRGCARQRGAGAVSTVES